MAQGRFPMPRATPILMGHHRGSHASSSNSISRIPALNLQDEHEMVDIPLHEPAAAPSPYLSSFQLQTPMELVNSTIPVVDRREPHRLTTTELINARYHRKQPSEPQAQVATTALNTFVVEKEKKNHIFKNLWLKISTCGFKSKPADVEARPVTTSMRAGISYRAVAIPLTILTMLGLVALFVYFLSVRNAWWNSFLTRST